MSQMRAAEELLFVSLLEAQRFLSHQVPLSRLSVPEVHSRPLDDVI